MASPAASARPGARGRALVLALAACALALAALVAILSRGREAARAPTAAPDVAARAPEEVRVEPTAVRDEVDAPSERAAIVDDVPGAPEGPVLRGLLLDEVGAPIDGRTARVTLRGALNQWLELGADGQGRFGPQRMIAGTWSVSAGAPGRRGASREFEVREDVALEPLRLVLPRVRVLEVRVVAVGPTSSGDPVSDLYAFERLLSLRLVIEGEERAMHTSLSRRDADNRGGKRFARFEPPLGRGGTVELLLGGESVLQRPVGPDEREVQVSVDPLDLAARLVELDLVLIGADGLPLANVSQMFLSWAGGVHLTSGQPGPDPARAHFEACPSGPARLNVVDVDGRLGRLDLVVPYESPARLEVVLELVEPARD